MADEMPDQIQVPGLIHLVDRLLHEVFSDIMLARGDRFADCLRRMAFAHRKQSNFFRISAKFLTCRGNPRSEVSKPE
jgi:hypothetical protein